MNSAMFTVDIIETTKMPSAMASELWRESRVTPYIQSYDLPYLQQVPLDPNLLTTMTSMFDPWSHELSVRHTVVTVPTLVKRMLIEDFGWTREQIIETRLRLRVFEEDWDAPGMELYDKL